MKTFRIYSLLFLVSLLWACDSLLDVKAKNTINGDIYKNTAQIEEALVGAYYGIGGIADAGDGGELFGGDFMLIPTLLGRLNGSELFISSVQAPAYADFIDKNILVTNFRVESNWRRAYEVINQVNNILANLDNIDDQADRDRIQGEALAIRGLLYFEMVRLWAPQIDADGVNSATDLAIPILIDPIVEVDDIETPIRSTIDQVYERAELDLIQASSLLESLGKNGSRLSYYSCQAYLARLSMQKSDFSSAYDYADIVISSGVYSLASTPLAAFNNTINSSEDIFAIQQTLANNSGDRTTGIGITTIYSSLVESGLGIFGILGASLNSGFLVNSPNYDPADLRGAIQLNTDSSSTAEDVTALFYKNVANVALLSTAKYLRADHVIPIIRLAEMYLTRAEAQFENTLQIDASALSDLNMIRNRAGLTDLTPTDLNNDPFEFYDAIKQERERELIYEGHLLHDLKRWGDFVGFGTDDPWDDNYVLPIPQSETDTWKGD